MPSLTHSLKPMGLRKELFQKTARQTESRKNVKHVQDAKQNRDDLGKFRNELQQKKEENMRLISREEGPILTSI